MKNRLTGIACLIVAILICVVGRGEDGAATGAIPMIIAGIAIIRGR